MHELSNEEHGEIQKLAYQRWEERGGPLGSPDDDWFGAERDFERKTTPESSPEAELESRTASAG